MDRNRSGLTEEELLRRLRAGAPASVAHRINSAWLADLQKDALVPNAVRLGNEGRRPVYRYDRNAYRRAAQIARFQRYGTVSRDSLLVLLFFNGYGVSAPLVREALAREWRKWGVNILRQIRSGYLGNQKAIPPKHKASFVRDIGPLDPPLAALELPIPEDLMIAMLRSVANAQIMSVTLPKSPPNRQSFLESFSAPGQIQGWLINAIAGLLLFGGKRGDHGKDAIEGIILTASNSDLELARSLAVIVTPRLTSVFGAASLARTPNAANAVADKAIRRTIRNHPGYAALTLITCLRITPLLRGVSEPVLRKTAKIINRVSLIRAFGRRIPAGISELS